MTYAAAKVGTGYTLMMIDPDAPSFASPTCASHYSKNCTGLAQIVGQAQASHQSKRWAKSRNLGQPSETHI